MVILDDSEWWLAVVSGIFPSYVCLFVRRVMYNSVSRQRRYSIEIGIGDCGDSGGVRRV